MCHSVEGNTWNAVGAASYQSKGTYLAFSTNSKFGSHSFNANGVNRLHHANYDCMPFASDFTLEFWAYPTSLASDQYCFGRGDLGSTTVGAYFKMNSGGAGHTFWWQGANVTTSTTASLFAVNTWYHIAIVRSGTTVKTFINGVPR